MTVSFYHLCASMRACVRVCLCLWRGLPRYFYCGCAAETITLLSYSSRVRKAFYSYLTPGTVARSVACKFRKQVLRSILAPGYSFVGSKGITITVFQFMISQLNLEGSAVAWWLMPRTPDPEVGGSTPTRIKPCCVLEQGAFTPQKYW